MLRVIIMSMMMAVMVFITLMYASGVISSGWIAARLFVGVGFSLLDLIHTVLLHILHELFPNCRPRAEVLYMSGARSGSPGFKA